MKDKERLLNEVRSTASEFIDEINSHFDQIKEKELLQSKADDISYNLTDQALKAHEAHSGKELTNEEPAMFIHGVSNEFQSFGEVNNLDFDQYKQERTAYTVAIPQDTGLTLVISSQYERGEYIYPLHQLDKEQLVDKETYTTLENRYHDVLLKQDEDYIQSFAARLRTEVYKEEATATDKDKKISKSNTLEIER